MYLTITPTINNYQTIKTNKNRNNQPNPEIENTKQLALYSYNNLNFMGKYPANYIRPVFKNPKLELLRDKVAYYVTKFPAEAKMPKHTILKTDAGDFAIKVDKTFKDLTKVFIKDLKNSNNAENWNDLEKTCEGIEMMIDKKGQMVSASWYEPKGLNILFERSKNARRIRFGNYFYLPISTEEYIWKRMKEVPGMKPFYSAAEKMEFNNTDLQIFFSELARNKTSFLGN